MTGALLPEPAVQFRRRLLDLLAGDADRFVYIDQDRCIAVCPVCDGPLTIRFAGIAARADLICQRSCDEAEVEAAVRAMAAR
jgi:hypothetical protein